MGQGEGESERNGVCNDKVYRLEQVEQCCPGHHLEDAPRNRSQYRHIGREVHRYQIVRQARQADK